MKNILTVKIGLCLLLMCGINYSDAQGTWTQEANFSGGIRNNDAYFTIGHYGYIGAGSNGSSVESDFWRWNQHTNTWSAIANYPGAGPFVSTSFSIGQYGYVGLGKSSVSGGTVESDLWRYDTVSNTWTQMASLPGAARYGASVFVLGHKAYVIGGSQGGPPYLNDVWMYDAHQNIWTQKSNYPGGDIEGPIVFSVGNYGYAGGGWTDAATAASDFWRYDTTNDTWTNAGSLPIGIAQYPITFVLGSRAYVCNGGQAPSAHALSLGYVYDTVTKLWTTFTNMGANGIERYYAAAFSIGNYGYIGTGNDSTGALLQDFWQYYPCSDTNMGVNELLTNNGGINIYPNPTDNMVNIAYKGTYEQKNVEFKITDVTGRTVLSQAINLIPNQSTTVYLNYLASGMYFYQVTMPAKVVSTGKLVIVK